MKNAIFGCFHCDTKGNYCSLFLQDVCNQENNPFVLYTLYMHIVSLIK